MISQHETGRHTDSGRAQKDEAHAIQPRNHVLRRLRNKSGAAPKTTRRFLSHEPGYLLAVKEIPLTPVDSSQMKAIGHDPETDTLVIEFPTGAIYHYSKFTTADFVRFTSAPSLGSHFIKHIKSGSVHPFTKVKEPTNPWKPSTKSQNASSAEPDLFSGEA